ncbi:MAG: hypothetical protein KHZ21_14135 [Klebsiella variicola]|nr:hypothetical protein [Klebsiella variicola]
MSGEGDGIKKKRNIVEALSMPEVADIDVEFPRSRELPRIIDFREAGLADLVNGITPDNLPPEISTDPEVGRERDKE